MVEVRKGCQIPTQSVILPYTETYGEDAIELYEETGRTAQEWQQLLMSDILAVNEEGLWVHTKFGYSVPRRNGKNEVVGIRELFGLIKGERILHTAHRTTTSHSAFMRLTKFLDDMGYVEVVRKKKDEAYSKHYIATKQFGLEKITLLDSCGVIDFRTRSSKGGLGEGFDLLVIDEAQEYTDDQESALKYVVTDSKNPQTIFCGTPPTPVSSGTVFTKLRENALSGGSYNTGWAEWSVSVQSNPRDKELWYQANPSLGTVFTERSVMDEVGSDEIDFNIQRLGLWIKYNQKSAISKTEWKEMEVDVLPQFKGQLFAGIKYGKDGTNVALSIACKTVDNRIFVETIDCRPIRDGNSWIIKFLSDANIKNVIVDGAGGQSLLTEEMKKNKLKQPLLPTVKEVISANSIFEQGIFQHNIVHMNQPSLTQSISNCEKRAIGTNGGFGYKSLRDDIEISLLDSVIFAYWMCVESKEKKKQKASY